MKGNSIFAVLTLCLSSVAAAAQAGGPYVGILGGSLETRMSVPFQTFTLNEVGEPILIGDEVVTAKKHRPAYGVLLGWQLHPSLALETSYLRSAAKDEIIYDQFMFETRVSAWSATALYTLPLSSRWSAHARLGGVRRMNRTTSEFGESATFTDHSNGFLYGAGLGMRIERLKLRLDLQRSRAHSLQTGIISLGANWYF